jgi:hypothetical protein
MPVPNYSMIRTKCSTCNDHRIIYTSPAHHTSDTLTATIVNVVTSTGVVFAEMILGTADVFSVDQRTSALISHRMRRSSPQAIELAMKLAAMSEFCISSGEPGGGGGGYKGALNSVYMHEKYLSPTASVLTCGEFSLGAVRLTLDHACVLCVVCVGIEQLQKALHRRDPLGRGYSHPQGLDLLARLLKWNPSERITLGEALLHAYFVGTCVRCDLLQLFHCY